MRKHWGASVGVVDHIATQLVYLAKILLRLYNVASVINKVTRMTQTDVTLSLLSISWWRSLVWPTSPVRVAHAQTTDGVLNSKGPLFPYVTASSVLAEINKEVKLVATGQK